MKKIKDTFRCQLKVISPIHLGCDEVYEPLGFVVDEGNNAMTVFDPVVFIESLSDEERLKFAEICKKGTIESILEIYKFFRGRSVEGRPVKLCGGFVSHYQKVLSLKPSGRELLQNLNQFQISKTAFRPSDERPYIPGTAIKGAIRTAYLNACARHMKIPTPRGKKGNIELQERLMRYDARRLESDPFRLVKVSDFRPVGDVTTRIVYAINKKKRVSDREARGPYQILEVIDPGAIFTGTITVDSEMQGGNRQSAIDMVSLINSVGIFYATENGRECDELKRIGIEGVMVRKDEKSVPLRIGRHSGAESITVEGHRSIKILKGKKEYDFQPNATTVWLASEIEKSAHNKRLLPFGWAELEPLTQTMERDLQAEEKDYCCRRALADKIRLEEATEKRIEKAQQEAEAERTRFEKEQQEKAEAERLKILESLSTEDRLLAEFDENTISEEQVNIAFKTIDEFPTEKRVVLARKLKDYWLSRKNWTKKDVGNKKWKTVRDRNQKLDEILGE